MQKENKIIKWLLITLCAVFLTVMLILPLIYVVTTAFRDGVSAFLKAVGDKYAVKSILLTLKVTVITVIVNTFFGIFAAWTITKYSFLYPYLTKMGIKIIFAVPGIVLATIFVTFPFISREIIPVMTAAGTDEEEAAALMGAGFFKIFTQVTLPHIKWALLYGIVLCSARAMGEFGAVSVISGHLRGKTNTMPLHIEVTYQAFDFTGAFAMSSILVVMALIILITRNILEYYGKKSEEESVKDE